MTRIVQFGDAGPGAKPLGEKSVFEIGSITKVFTGILLADMVARGEVALNDPVAKYLPDGVTMPTRNGKEITLLDLAAHHSALPRLPGNMSPADHANPYADYTVQQMYDFLSAYQLERDIGSEYEYSNLAVGLLGQALALVGGGSYEDVVRERILMPLEMNMTGIELNEEMQKWMTQGHDMQREVTKLWDIPTLAGAGALRSNTSDMLLFLAANTGTPETTLERSMRNSQKALKTLSDQMDVGLNWHIRKVGGKKIVWHNGGTGGFRSFLGFDPDENVGVVVLSNSAQSAEDIGFHLVNQSLPLVQPAAAVKRITVEVANEILESYVGTYELTPNFSIAISLEQGSLFAQATGQAKFPLFAESETKFFFKVVNAQISFVFDNMGKVDSLILHQNNANQAARKVD